METQERETGGERIPAEDWSRLRELSIFELGISTIATRILPLCECSTRRFAPLRRTIEIETLKRASNSTFKMTYCGEIRFSGIKQEYDRKNCSMIRFQGTNIDKLLIRFKLKNCNPNKPPTEKNLAVYCEGEEI